MSSGSKKSTSTTISTNDPPAWSTSYFQNALNYALNEAKSPYEGYEGATVAGFTDDQLAAFGLTNQLASQNQESQALTSDYLNSLISGGQSNPYLGDTNQYAGENPYLQAMIDAANKDITTSYSDVTLPTQLAQFNSGGAYGGSAMQQALTSGQNTLAQQLSDTTTQLRSEDYDRQTALAESALDRNSSLYNQDVQNRLSAVNGLSTLQTMGYNDVNALLKNGSLQQALVQQAIDDDVAAFEEERDWSANQLGILTNALASIKGGTSTNSTTGDNPNYKSATENAAGYAAILASLFA